MKTIKESRDMAKELARMFNTGALEEIIDGALSYDRIMRDYKVRAEIRVKFQNLATACHEILKLQNFS